MPLVLVIVLPVFIGVISGAMFALAVKSPLNKRAFEERRLRFATGAGKDPALARTGPHRSFWQNFKVFATILGAIAFVKALLTLA